MKRFLVGFLALAACSGSDSMSGDDGSGGGGGGGGGGGSDDAAQVQQDYDDVAASIGANINSGELAGMVDSINLAYGRIPAGFSVDSPENLSGTRGGLQVQYKYYCRDTADLVTPCNGLEDHAHIRVDWTGSISSANATVDGVTRDGSWIVRDVITATPRVGGHGTMSFISTLATGTYTVSFTDEFGHVKFDSASPLLPIGGGTMDLTLTIHRTRDAVADRDFTVVAHIEFTAADAATITLDAMHTYDLTVSTGAVVRVN